ncbi:hypothetical protein CTAYLR_009510 [Chrysophaeum taylorii]|uniref:Protein translocase subunit SecA n=1 Tax=Chrysophaeum taylorii TaxID=2483200 RepID=A0AAD7ULI6_9STRA|nr:hypothetical protein CTAYLR_009510 [Chrysophaeum taylorii]
MVACRAFRAPGGTGGRQVIQQKASTKPVFELSKAQKVVTDYGVAALKAAEEKLSKINGLEGEIEKLSDGELRDRLVEDGSLESVFAVAREAAWRVLGLRAFDVQVLGGLVIAEGGLAEMATGEGKTLAAVAPVVYHALRGKGALVVTANDYLARRDADSVGQVARFLGLSVGLVEAGVESAARRKAYACDVTYVSNAELGFDFLRDALAYAPEDVVLRDSSSSSSSSFGFAVVDEADSILIDEARTPLIISEQVAAPAQKCEVARDLVEILREPEHYAVDSKASSAVLSEAGYRECQAALGIEDLADPRDPWAPFISNALRAKGLLVRDRDYVVRGDPPEVAIVDSFSGRVLEGRRWSDGLQQAVECKERTGVSPMTRPAASITFQALFGGDNLISTLAGMTGTASTDADEFSRVYGLGVVPIPTALPIARQDYEDAVYQSVEAKWRAAAAEVARAHAANRPVLVGTTSVEDSEDFTRRLRETYGIRAVALNARPEVAAQEGAVVAQAGRLGAVTVATNMAGRGTDIVLGGDSKFATKQLVERLLLLEEEDGNSAVLLSPETRAELKKAVASTISKLGSGGRLTRDEAEQASAATVESNKGGLADLRRAARRARDEIEAHLASEKAEVRRLGGLYVIGTERHESRRVDRQLRGRAGRQGDPGASRFFVSVEDRLFKIFGGDTIQRVMRTLRVGDDIPIEAKPVTDALSKIQEQVEKRNEGLRTAMLAFEEVVDAQRTQIYALRKSLLMASDVQAAEICRSWTASTANAVLGSAKDDFDLLKSRFDQMFAGAANFEVVPDDGDNNPEDFGIDLDAVFVKVGEARPQRSPARSFASLALLRLDKLWADHLANLNDLKDSVQFRAYQGTAPIEEYQRDAFALFSTLQTKLRSDTTYSFFQLLLVPPPPP